MIKPIFKPFGTKRSVGNINNIVILNFESGLEKQAMETLKLRQQYLKNALFDQNTISLLEQSIEYSLSGGKKSGFVVRLDNITGKALAGGPCSEIAKDVVGLRDVLNRLINEKNEHPLSQELLFCLAEPRDVESTLEVGISEFQDLAYQHLRFHRHLYDLHTYIHGNALEKAWWIGDVLSSDLSGEDLRGLLLMQEAVKKKISPIFVRVCPTNENGDSLINLYQFQGRIPPPRTLDEKLLAALYQGGKLQKARLFLKRNERTLTVLHQPLETILGTFSRKTIRDLDEVRVDLEVANELMFDGRYQEALVQYNELGKRIHESDLPVLYNNRAFCYKNLDQYEKACDDLFEAVELEPNFPNPYALLGEIYQNIEDKEKAREYYRKCLTLLDCLPYARISPSDCRAGIRAEKGLKLLGIEVTDRYHTIAQKKFSDVELNGFLGSLPPSILPP